MLCLRRKACIRWLRLLPALCILRILCILCVLGVLFILLLDRSCETIGLRRRRGRYIVMRLRRVWIRRLCCWRVLLSRQCNVTMDGLLSLCLTCEP